MRAHLLPLLIEKDAAGKQDKVRAVNEKGTVVWVKKDTLREQPGKFKPYKYEEDKGKGGGAEKKKTDDEMRAEWMRKDSPELSLLQDLDAKERKEVESVIKDVYPDTQLMRAKTDQAVEQAMHDVAGQAGIHPLDVAAYLRDTFKKKLNTAPIDKNTKENHEKMLSKVEAYLEREQPWKAKKKKP